MRRKQNRKLTLLIRVTRRFIVDLLLWLSENQTSPFYDEVHKAFRRMSTLLVISYRKGVRRNYKKQLEIVTDIYKELLQLPEEVLLFLTTDVEQKKEKVNSANKEVKDEKN